MIPSADMFGKVVDCRCLKFRGSYYRFDNQQAVRLAKTFYSYVTALLGETCILCWELEGHAMRNIDLLAQVKSPYFTIGLNGDVKSSIVYNKTSLRAYEKELRNSPVFDQGITPPFASVDYPEYAVQNLLPYQKDPKKFEKQLMQVFSLENRLNLYQYHDHDILGFFDNSPYEGSDDKYAGTIELAISCYSLDDELDVMAERLHRFGLSLSEQFTDINITIGIEQTSCDYGRYFGGAQLHPQIDPISNQAFLLKHRSQYLYMKQVGWSNIISPFVCNRINWTAIPEANAHIDCCELSSGALCVKSKEPISATTLAILREAKRAMYPVMFPGMNKFPIDYPYFRSRWENVPILDGELNVIRDKVFIRYKGYLDEEYLMNDR